MTFTLVNEYNGDYAAIDKATGELYLGKSGETAWVATFKTAEAAIAARAKYLPNLGLTLRHGKEVA